MPLRTVLIIILSSLLTTRARFPLDVWDGVVGTEYFSRKELPTDTYLALETSETWNPLHGDSDVRYRWIGNSSSVFGTSFLLDKDEFAAERALLVLQGVDTFARILVNNRLLGNTSNMHLRYVYDVKEYLTFPEQNKILIKFESAVKVAESLYNNHSKAYPVYPKCVPSSYNGECHVNHIRKMQASFSWDWGPAFPVAGLWAVPKLLCFNESILFDTSLDLELMADGLWRLTVTAHLENAASSPSKPLSGSLAANLTLNASEYCFNSTSFSITSNEKTSFLSLTLSIPNSKVLRWWPNGYGQQKLYDLNITLTTPRHFEYKNRRVGFRTVQLIQEPLKKGLSFYFKVNDVPIFAKGTNLIPINILARPLLRNMKAISTVRTLLLQYMKDTYQNMVRVWGGGIYEIEDFYDMADEYGIMVWQDFMFACAMYPTTPEFLASVREEVRQTVWRLKSHSSVVLWAGNNENEAALYGNWYGTGKEQVYKDDYIKLYVDLIKKEVEESDRLRPFLTSSPTNADYSAQNGWVETNPYSNLYGDIHYYNYLANGWDINTYKRPRFSSEYGFQSLPSIKTLRSMSKNPKVDLVKGSDFLKHRQHLPGGDAFMDMQIKFNFNLPNTSDPQRDFASYVYLSQVQQAMAVKVQTESYRQAKSSIDEAGEGMTMGALYWQLNDVWAAPSWSSIDADGRWKILHNYAEEFFAPVIVTSRLTLDQLTIFIVSDLMEAIVNCHVDINFHRIWTESRPKVYTKSLDKVTVPVNSAMELPTLSLQDILMEASCGATLEEAKKSCIIELILWSSDNKKMAPANYVYPTPPKNLDLPACDIGLSISRYPSSNVPDRLRHFYDGYDATVTSGCTQLFVWIDGHEFNLGRFSENGFHLLEESKKIVFLTARGSYPELRDLPVTSLGSIYAPPKP